MTREGECREKNMDYEYIEATEDLLERILEKNIISNSEDERWVKWREEALENHASGKSKTFLILYRGEPVGEGTLLFAEDCSAIRGRRMLADGKEIANINALRIEKEHEGKGHVSKLVGLMEQYAFKCGYQKLTIGVEAKEARNLAIYLHWKYQELVHTETEDGSLVLYYAKNINKNRP